VNAYVPDHLDALEERVNCWSEWLRDEIRAGSNEERLRAEFAEYEHSDLRARGASEEDVQGYEAADPSYMAVGAAIRYWKKYHPDAVMK